MKEKKRFWTLRYALVNISYYMAFCTIHAFAAVYLAARGFSYTQIGILLAIANILSAVLQPLVAGLVDKPGMVTNRLVVIVSSAIIAAGSVMLLLTQDSKAAVFIIFIIIYMVQFVYQPIITAMFFEYERAGANINYGLSRGLGSAGFAITSAFTGNLVNSLGVDVLLYGNIIIMALAIVLVIFFRKPAGGEDGALAEKAAEGARAHNNIIEFAKLYPMFILFLAGAACFFFAHNMINDFMIEIIKSQTAHGGEKELGYATFLAAILELPTMAFITKVRDKISVGKLLIMSGIFFFIKTLILACAVNMTMVYISQVCQMFAYAVFIPAGAYYVEEIMDELDKVKGQALISSAITVGGIFSNLFSGRSIDIFGTRTTLVIGCLVCLIGVFISIKAIGIKNK